MTSSSNMLGITELHYSHIQMFSWDYLCVKSCTLRAGGCQGSPRGALMPVCEATLSTVSNPIDKLLSLDIQPILVRAETMCSMIWWELERCGSRPSISSLPGNLLFQNIDCLEVSNLVCCLFHIVITPPPPNTKTAFWPPFWPNLSKYVLECCRPALWE